MFCHSGFSLYSYNNKIITTMMIRNYKAETDKQHTLRRQLATFGLCGKTY